MRFSKMHGCGNDYVYLDCWQERPPEEAGALADLSRTVSDRHTGIGADGLILVGPSTRADARMQMFNADGSESEMCGNGLRCAAALAWNRGHLATAEASFETGAGLLQVACLGAAGSCDRVRVDMGPPLLRAADIPIEHAEAEPLIIAELELDGQSLQLHAVGMGNPHAVIFVEDAQQIPLADWGPRLEHHPLFPKRCNIEFVHRLPGEDGLPLLRQRTWERGSGETRACGTGACAVAVAAMLTERVPVGSCTVRLDGGDLCIAWDGPDSSVIKEGEAVHVFDGIWPN